MLFDTLQTIPCTRRAFAGKKRKKRKIKIMGYKEII